MRGAERRWLLQGGVVVVVDIFLVLVVVVDHADAGDTDGDRMVAMDFRRGKLRMEWGRFGRLWSVVGGGRGGGGSMLAVARTHAHTERGVSEWWW